MELEVHSGRPGLLRAYDVRRFLDGPHVTVGSEKADDLRGAMDVVLAVIDESTSVAVSSALTAIWMAWRRRRRDELQESETSIAKVDILDENGTRVGGTTVEFRGSGDDAAKEILTEVEKTGPTIVQRVRIVYPD